MTKLADSYHRPINYLRISVTVRCNLRCICCMPPEGISLMSHEDVLRYEEIYLVAQAAAELGITKVRITGGEPLVRAGIADLVAMLAKIGDRVREPERAAWAHGLRSRGGAHRRFP